jgi:putative membrane protein
MKGHAGRRSKRCRVGCEALIAAACAACLSPGVALAHPGEPHGSGDLWTYWRLDPVLGLAIALGTLTYVRGLLVMLGRARAAHLLLRRLAVAFGGSILALSADLLSPLDGLSGVLFSAHMVQHLLLILVAAPLLAVSRPLAQLLWALPRPWRRALGRLRAGGMVWRQVRRFFGQPLAIWALHAGALWLWHLPVLYEAALVSEPVHALEHATFLLTALLFWNVLLAGSHSPRRSGMGVLYTFTMALQGSLLGALITFTAQPWYSTYAEQLNPWGLTPLADQQLAGAIMWVPSGAVYVLAACWLFVTWLNAVERRASADDLRGVAGRLPGQPRGGAVDG